MMNNLNPSLPIQHKDAYFRASIIVENKLVINDFAHPNHANDWLRQTRCAHALPETAGQVFEVWH